jgi:hypothetical protein
MAYVATPTGAPISFVSAAGINRGAAAKASREELRLVLHPLSPGAKRVR